MYCDKIFEHMKNFKDLNVPIFIDLDCKSSKEVDFIVKSMQDLAVETNLESNVALKLVQPHPYYNETAVATFSILTNVSENGDNVVKFLESVFENYYQNYPRFAEPVT